MRGYRFGAGAFRPLSEHRAQSAQPEFGDRYGQGVRGVARKFFIETQDRAHHLRDLRLLRATIPGQGPLDAGRGVLPERNSGSPQGQKNDAASVPKLRRCLRIFVKEELLDRTQRRAMFSDDSLQFGCDGDQAIGERFTRARVNHPMRHVNESDSAAFDDAPAQMNRSRVDAEHEHETEPNRDDPLGEARFSMRWDEA